MGLRGRYNTKQRNSQFALASFLRIGGTGRRLAAGRQPAGLLSAMVLGA